MQDRKDAFDRLIEFDQEILAYINAQAAEIDRLRHALAFYADQRRYQGPNQRPIPGDQYAPDEDFPYLWDVLRDYGETARAALCKP